MLALTICGALVRSSLPLMVTPPSGFNPAIRCSRVYTAFRCVHRKSLYASRAATPSPTHPGTFSVPERMPFCWPPPNKIGRMLDTVADIEESDALRRMDLVSADGKQVNALFFTGESHTCHRPEWHPHEIQRLEQSHEPALQLPLQAELFQSHYLHT